jgi:hypothetical protein
VTSVDAALAESAHAKTGLTEKQKALVMLLVVQKRVEVAVSAMSLAFCGSTIV